MRVLVTGATGYIGGRLVPELLAAGHQVRCLARTPSKLDGEPWRDQIEVAQGDVSDAASLAPAMEGCEAAYYLVHSMGTSPDFARRDRNAAETFATAAAEAGLARIVYLGGLGDDDDELSPHLRSRHEVGEVLAAGEVPVTELRAAVIIGSGSASFEMLRYLVEVLPVMVTPRWVTNRCQPTAVRDILFYLVAVLDHPETAGRVLSAGGPDVVTYEEMMRTYARIAGLGRRRIITVPVLSPTLSSHWIGVVTPLPTGLAKPLVESLTNEVVADKNPVSEIIDRQPIGFADAVSLALTRVSDLEVTTRWSDAALPGRDPAHPLPSDPDWAGGSLLEDTQQATSDAEPEAVFRVVAGIGGKRGWYVTPFLWSLRGWADQVVGGVGMRRGRRHPDDLRVGDAVDFWRVEAVERPELVRLRAEMRLPGEAWLEWRIERTGDGDSSELCQKAIFYPRGLLGRAYWYVLIPFHAVIFRRLAQRLTEAAESHPTHARFSGDQPSISAADVPRTPLG